MTVRRHFLAILFACVAITVAGTYALHVAQQHEADAVRAAFADERREQLADALAEQSESLRLFVQDYGQWDEMVAFVRSLDPEWARLNIAASLERFQLDAVWLLSPAGEILHVTRGPAGAELAPPTELRERLLKARYVAPSPTLAPSTPSTPSAPEAEVGGFFRQGERLIEARAGAVRPTADVDRRAAPAAWLVVARIQDQALPARLERRLKAAVTLHPESTLRVSSPTRAIVVHQFLPGLPGDDDAGVVQATFTLPALELGDHYNRRELALILGVGALTLVLVAWSIDRLVLRPLLLIGRSLESESPGPLAGLSPEPPEFARIGALVRESFRQREALHREIEERARLGRDLHDGVIQNLYATGLGIAQGLRLLERQPADAAARLEETRRLLNDTMENLRRFIARAEPEPSAEIVLGDACVELFQALRAHRECVLDLDLAPAADAQLDAPEKATLLFILREAVSNALRHGAARRVAVSLRQTEETWALRIEDDGGGCAPATLFPPSSVPERASGRGLANIRTRAAELGGSARFELRAPPATGVAISVVWPARARR